MTLGKPENKPSRKRELLDVKQDDPCTSEQQPTQPEAPGYACSEYLNPRGSRDVTIKQRTLLGTSTRDCSEFLDDSRFVRSLEVAGRDMHSYY